VSELRRLRLIHPLKFECDQERVKDVRHQSEGVPNRNLNQRRHGNGAMPRGRSTSRAGAGCSLRENYLRTKPTMSLTAFMVSAAIACARCEPSASTLSI